MQKGTPSNIVREIFSLKPYLIAWCVLVLFIMGYAGWWVLSTPDVRFGGATGPTGEVVTQGPDFVLTGDTGGTITSIRNEGRFPVTINIPKDYSDNGWRIHVGMSPTEDGYVIPAGSDRELTPEEVQAPFHPVTLRPGDLAWVSSTTWFPLDCRALGEESPEKVVENGNWWSNPSTVTLVGSTLGRPSSFTVKIPTLFIPLKSESELFSLCGTFAIE